MLDPRAVVGLGHAGHVSAMDQMGVDDAVGVAAEQAIDPPPVGVDAVAFVGHRRAHVKRVERGNADAAAPGENRMAGHAIVGQPVEAEVVQAVVLDAFQVILIETEFLRRNSVSRFLNLLQSPKESTDWGAETRDFTDFTD